MLNSVFEPTIKKSSSEKVYDVYKTNDYSLFKFMSNNRNVNLAHVERLRQSFEVEHLISPIIVNERMEIIDGQHRYKAARLTGKPIYYIIIDGYNIKEVQIYNANQKNWTKKDYLEMYCSEGRTPYLQMKQFMIAFPELGLQSSERIITLRFGTGSRIQKKFQGKNMLMKDFENGKLFVPDLKKSYKIARKILDFKPYYSNFHRGTFVSAVAPIFDHKDYNHNEMIKKLSKIPNGLQLQDCLNTDQYRLMIEDIWNWRRNYENKVSFRHIK